MPEELDAAESHEALLAAFQVQPACVVTSTEPLPAAAPTFAPFDDNDHVHVVDPLCFDALKFATVSAF